MRRTSFLFRHPEEEKSMDFINANRDKVFIEEYNGGS